MLAKQLARAADVADDSTDHRLRHDLCDPSLGPTRVARYKRGTRLEACELREWKRRRTRENKAHCGTRACMGSVSDGRRTRERIGPFAKRNKDMRIYSVEWGEAERSREKQREAERSREHDPLLLVIGIVIVMEQI